MTVAVLGRYVHGGLIDAEAETCAIVVDIARMRIKTAIYRLIFALARTGAAVIMVWSEMPELLGIADRVLVIGEGELRGDLLTAHNFSNLLRQMASGMLASGMVFVIVSGEIDLSVGSLLGLLGGGAAILDVTYPMPLPVTVPMLLGIAAGLFNGYWVAHLRIRSCIVTLAGMLVFRGITGGVTIAPTSPPLVAIGQSYLPDLIGYGLAAAGFALLVYVQVSSRQRRPHKLGTPPVWLDAIAPCVIGGTSLHGGSGTVFGALVMASLDDGMSMLGVDTFWQMIVKGVILLLAVWLDIATGTRRRGRLDRPSCMAAMQIGHAVKPGVTGIIVEIIAAAVWLASLCHKNVFARFLYCNNCGNFRLMS